MKGERRVGTLTCSQVLASLSDYLDGAIDPAHQREIEVHVVGCDVCARFGAVFADIVEAVRKNVAEPEPLDAATAARLRERLHRFMR